MEPREKLRESYTAQMKCHSTNTRWLGCDIECEEMLLLQALRIATKDVEANIEKSKLFSHMGNRGEFREKVIAEFLRPFLPRCYGLDSGEVFSSDGHKSAQIDIVLYDAMFSTVYPASGKMLFPAESIFGSIEVKSNLTIPELDTACGNIASVKTLNRAPTDALDLLPHVRLALGAGLSLMDPHLCNNPYLCIVFGYRGTSAKTIARELNKRIAANHDRQTLPDFVFVAQPGYMIVRTNANQPAPIGGAFDKYHEISTGADTMACLFLMLNSCVGSLRLRRFDADDVWRQIVKDHLSALKLKLRKPPS